MFRAIKRLLIGGFIVLLLATIAFVILSSDPKPALPNPNGYDDFVKAGQMLTSSVGSRDLSEYWKMSLTELRLFALTNAEALKVARTGLSRECRVPLKRRTEWFRAHMDDMANFNRLAYAFCLTGRLAWLEGRTNEAINAHLDVIRFAHETARGGLLPDESDSRSMESSALWDLKNFQRSLDAAQNHYVAKSLQDIDERSESWGDFLKRDLRYTVRAEYTALFSLNSWRVLPNQKARFHQAQAWHRQVMLDFAVHSYELEKGDRPKRLTDLIPVYLKAIPRDPTSGTDFVYTP